MPNLSELSDGQSAVVKALHLPASSAARLMELGVMEGVRVTVLRRSPLGDPLELEVGGARLSLRGADARLVEMAP